MLAEALLDFAAIADLENWLKKPTPPTPNAQSSSPHLPTPCPPASLPQLSPSPPPSPSA